MSSRVGCLPRREFKMSQATALQIEQDSHIGSVWSHTSSVNRQSLGSEVRHCEVLSEEDADVSRMRELNVVKGQRTSTRRPRSCYPPNIVGSCCPFAHPRRQLG